jgi:hypothetical protein
MMQLTGGIVQTHADRTNRLREIFKETDGDLKRFRADRKQMSAELRAELEKFLEALTKETRQMLKQFRATHKAMSGQQRKELEQFVAELEKTTAEMRNGFRKEHQQMSRQLREFLGEFMEQFLKGCNAERKQRRQFVADNEKETAQMRKGFQAEQHNARQAWHKMATTMVKQRQDGARQLAAMSRPHQTRTRRQVRKTE